MDLPGQVGVRLQLELGLDEVVVGLGLLVGPACRFWPIMTKVDRKIASSDTMSVRVGHGLCSNMSIQITKSTAWR